MASGGLGFPTKNCAQAFFNGIMEFLEENECITTLKKLNIVILEEPKHKEFQEKWIECFVDKYGEDLPSSDEEAAPEVSSDSEEETKIDKSKKKTSLGMNFDSDDDAKGSKKGSKKPQDQNSKAKAVPDKKADAKKKSKPKTQIFDSSSDDADDKKASKAKKAVSKAKHVLSDSDSDAEDKKKSDKKNTVVKKPAGKKKIEFSDSD
uniref:Uncharacterized protein n=1 Tax=Euplotes harpa TaxID=151035 RepID=A0A7S3J961_9SPIT|mmetsp:Transcript_22331/g.25656  ORF Transcript_22331/g.25656 Transcript_22331/m.25656 type:complete len:206 (+) Transcript_22331:434-1051(+)